MSVPIKCERCRIDPEDCTCQMLWPRSDTRYEVVRMIVNNSDGMVRKTIVRHAVGSLSWAMLAVVEALKTDAVASAWVFDSYAQERISFCDSDEYDLVFP